MFTGKHSLKGIEKYLVGSFRKAGLSTIQLVKQSRHCQLDMILIFSLPNCINLDFVVVALDRAGSLIPSNVCDRKISSMIGSVDR